MKKMPGLTPPKPIPIKDRAGYVFVEKGRLDVLDGAFVLVDKTGVRTHIPVGGLATILLEPGARVSHAAATLAASAGCLLLWIGEGGVRLYAAGQPGGARSDRLLYQARLALENEPRLNIVRKMFEMRFGEPPPARRSVDQLRGIEGTRVRTLYTGLAKQMGVQWKSRRYDPGDWAKADLPNRCLSAGTAALYGICEAAILAAGYSPAIGFLHTGKPQSFVYDIADIFKFETVVPVAFKIAAAKQRHQPFEGTPVDDPVAAVRRACRDAFRRTRLLGRLIPAVDEVLAAGGLAPPGPPPEAQPIAFPDPEPSGDAGHRG